MPAVSLPRAPAHLDRVAKLEWRRVGDLMRREGTITALDRAALAAYCSIWSQLVAIESALAEGPLLVDGPRNRPAENPLLKRAHQTREQLLRYALQLGLTPTSRNRAAVGADPDAGESDPFEEHER